MSTTTAGNQSAATVIAEIEHITYHQLIAEVEYAQFSATVRLPVAVKKKQHS